MSQTPFERAKEALTVANELLRTCRNYYVLGAQDRAELNIILDRTTGAEQGLNSLMLRTEG